LNIYTTLHLELGGTFLTSKTTSDVHIRKKIVFEPLRCVLPDKNAVVIPSENTHPKAF